MPGIVEKLQTFVEKTFKTTLEVFLEALKLSPNAQGYVSGSITELLLKEKLESLGVEVRRIREKWEGKKHHNHHGDFYFRLREGSPWYVLESKGVKSNTEQWHKLYNLNRLRKFLYHNKEIINWIDIGQPVEPQIERWTEQNLPEMVSGKYSTDLYSYEEIQDYLKNPPKTETDKLINMRTLEQYTRDEIDNMLQERLQYLMNKIMVLETHFVSGTSGSSARTQATPLKDEFNLISVDIVLRYSEHKFLFVNPKHLESSEKDSNHLQQNYVMGFVFPQSDGSMKIDLAEDWQEDFIEACETLDKKDAVRETDMQVDNRRIVVES